MLHKHASRYLYKQAAGPQTKKAVRELLSYYRNLVKKSLKTSNPIANLVDTLKGTADTDYQRFVNKTFSKIWQEQGGDRPYTSRISPDEIKDGDLAVITFTGAGVGQQEGDYGVFTKYDENGKPYFATKHLPDNAKVVMFRYHEYDDAVEYLKKLQGKNINVQVIGHSWGSDAASTLADNYNLGRPVLLDPVKRFDTFSKNAIIYQPLTADPVNKKTDRLAFLGGKREHDGSLKVPGDHRTMVIPAMDHFFKHFNK